MPSRARKPLTATQIRRTFYERTFEIQDLLSTIRRLHREGDARSAKQLESEAIHMAKELAVEMNAHAVTRALRANRIFNSSNKQRIRYAMYRINTNPDKPEIIEQNRRISTILGKKYKPFADDYNRMMHNIPAQIRAMALRKSGPTRTVFAVQPSPFALVRRLFPRKRGKRPG